MTGPDLTRRCSGVVALLLLGPLGGCRPRTGPPEEVRLPEAAPASESRAARGGDQTIAVRVDPRVELMCILARLADFEEYDQPLDYAYSRAAERLFEPWRDDPAVKALRAMRLFGVSYDAVISMAIHLSDPPELAAQGNWEGAERSLDERWQVDAARRFLVEARRFAAESPFEEFWRSQADGRRAAEERFAAALGDAPVVAWLQEFFGTASPATFHAVPGMLTGGASYGATALGEGLPAIYQVIGVTRADGEGRPVFEPSVLATMVHELCHAYANPLTEAHADALAGAGRTIYPHVAEVMQRQAYGSWETMLAETLVRASSAQYARHHEGDRAAAAAIRYEEEQRGFLWTGRLCEALDEYEANRDDYPDLESFMPRVIAVMNEVAAGIGDEMDQRERRRVAWREAEPVVDDALVDEVGSALLESIERADRVVLAAADDGERVRLLGQELGALTFEHDVQVTVLDGNGDFVFHVMGLEGSAFGHVDVDGRQVYRESLESSSGLVFNHDFVVPDGRRARANAIAWERVERADWWVFVEGHQWRSFDELEGL